MRTRQVSLLLSMCLAVTVAGCWHAPVPDPDLSAAEPRVLVLRDAHEPWQVRDAILAAMEKRRWAVESGSDSEVVARLAKKGVTVRLALKYTGDRVTVVGLTALGAGRSYEKWLSNLEQTIREEFKEPLQATRVRTPQQGSTQPTTPAPVEAPVAETVAVVEPPPPDLDPETGLPNTWSNRSGIYVGVHGGLAFPPAAVGLAPSVSLELGVAPSHGFGFGVRALWMSGPPGVPFLGLKPASYGLGALADFRYYIETIDPLIIYPTVALGFLAGPERLTQQNAAMPLLNLGVGAKVKFGNVYASFEFGVSGFTIPYVALSLGYESDSKIAKEAARLRLAENNAPAAEPTAP